MLVLEVYALTLQKDTYIIKHLIIQWFNGFPKYDLNRIKQWCNFPLNAYDILA